MANGSMFTKRFQMSGKIYEKNKNKPVIITYSNKYGYKFDFNKPVFCAVCLYKTAEDTTVISNNYAIPNVNYNEHDITLLKYSDIGDAIRNYKLITNKSDVLVDISFIDNYKMDQHLYIVQNVVYDENAIRIVIDPE